MTLYENENEIVLEIEGLWAIKYNKGTKQLEVTVMGATCPVSPLQTAMFFNKVNGHNLSDEENQNGIE